MLQELIEAEATAWISAEWNELPESAPALPNATDTTFGCPAAPREGIRPAPILLASDGLSLARPRGT